MKDRIKSNLTVLLASTAPQKIEATVVGLSKAMPLRGIDRVRGRRFVVEEEKGESVVVREKRQGLERVLPRRLLKGLNVLLPKENRVTVIAVKAPSNVPEQPIVERKSDIEQGFQGAANRVEGAIRRVTRHWDLAIGIENAQVAMTAPGGKESQIDIGFVVMKDSAGNQTIANSAGVIFGNNLGVDYFQASAQTGFSKPAGHLFSPDDPQDPHKKQTRGILSRPNLLRDPIIIAYTALPARR